MCIKVALIFLLAASPAAARMETRMETEQQLKVNPMRRVVGMLQMMQKKIETEGEKQKEIFDKFMCWCSTGSGQLSSSIDAAETKVPQVESSIKETDGALTQTKADLTTAKTSREEAKAAMAKATEARSKEAAEFAKESGDDKTNLAAMKKALAAIEKGTGGAFLQTESASVLKDFAVNTEGLSDIDRDVVVAFLSNDQQDESSDSGQILGIMKQMLDTMEKDLADITAAEDAAKTTYSELMAAKTKEVETLTAAIEEKTVRIGDMGVSLSQMKEDVDDTSKGLVDDKKFLADLETNCAKRKEEWAIIEKTRGEELLAIADTIKILNDDDALELFKKTLPGASFIQELVTTNEVRDQALALIQQSRRKSHKSASRVPLELITMALTGKKVNFDKVLKMIDGLVETLLKEQSDDDTKKVYCEKEIDELEDTKKAAQHAISDLDTLIEDTTEKIATTTDELKALADGITQLDKDVAEATETRKEENEDFKNVMASNTAAKELIGFAKNRMQKFYNPKLYKAPPKRELTESERITLNMGGTLAPTAAPAGIAGTGIGFVQVRMHSQEEVDVDGPPPPPPAAVPAYTKKSEESGGVLSMMDAMIGDLEKEMSTSEVEEKNAQEEYEEFMKDSAEKRAADSKAITDKEAAKAEMESALSKAHDDKTSKTGELMATEESLAGVHGECDWLMQNYESRKEARTGEEDNLKKAKAVLSGADYSLLQQTTKRRLRVRRN